MYWKKIKNNTSLWLEWNGWKDARAYFSTRIGKLTNFYSNIHQRNSEKKFAYLRQSHSDKICIVSFPGEYEGDGIVTNNPELTLRIKVADCLAIYIYDPVNKVICLVHAGWRGTEKRILEKGIICLKKTYGSLPSEICILFSPSICPHCFDVDIWSENENQARLLGVNKILNPRMCTYENPELFYSYRRDKCDERMHAVFELF